MTFSPDGNQLVFLIASNLWLWDQRKSQIELVYTNAAQGSWVRFSPDGRLLASFDNTTVRLRRVTNGEELPPISMSDVSNDYSLLAFSPDGRLLATAHIFMPQEAAIWDVASRQLVHRLKGHVAGVASLSFSSDSKTLVTGSGDHTVRFWQVSTGQEMLTLKDFGEQVFNLVFSSDGTMLATGGASWAQGPEPVRLWRAPPLAEIEVGNPTDQAAEWKKKLAELDHNAK
jgi:WD40 repeat protein